ncbi:hypothetical protein [Nonomuraea insulae]|uniref:Uncharacterized protein n=1 Tax=Nonomuraea insulae TaxID=1616787 RepID=A0ABW1CL56_9ACTN
MGAGMMRAAAKAVLGLYPKAWRERYGAEVGDLVASRPVRLRTVFDLAGGAADAWFHHRRIPGAGPVPLRIPLALLLPIAGYALLSLWNPGVRDVPSLNGVWAQAAGLGSIAESLARNATWMFIAAGATGVLAVVPLLLTAFSTMWRSAAGSRTRRVGRGVVMTAPILAVPVWMFCALFYQLTFNDVGFPVGPLGLAMFGGFVVPIVLSLVLPLPSIAAKVSALTPDVRACGNLLAVAAIMNGLGWLAVSALVVMGLPKASPGFLVAMAASVLVSMGMATAVARSALRQSRPALSELSLA